jgi:type VI secretion system protein ImpL
MFSSGSQLSYLLGISAYVSLYGIACLLAGFIGYSLGFEASTQIIIIALILLTLPFAILINHYRKKRALKKEAAAQAAAATADAPQSDKTPVAPKRVYDDLLRAAEEAVVWLRGTPLGGAKASEAVYALPWFVVAGPPASGKTSLLLSSELDFHALPSQRRAELKIVRPTHNSEWRMTDSAVWIDTAGRYQSDGLGREEWLALGETIRKHRANRPLDGLLLVVNADRLLHSNDTEIEQQAKTIRARVDELIRVAHVRFPVYLVFTNMDRLSGFSEFFSLGSDDNRAQVWGATIPLEKAANAHALFDVEFDLLRESLVRRRLLRLRQPAAPAAQLRTFVFPLRFSEARNKLGLFTSALFRPNPFSESPLLRGFYFTANVNNSQPRPAVVEDEAERSAHAVGEPYFTNQLFRDVLLRDKDLAGSFQAAQKHPPRAPFVLLAVASVLLLFLTLGGVVSFLNNRWLISEAVARGIRVDDIARADRDTDPTTKEAPAARAEIEAVESLREVLAQLDENEHGSRPLRLRFGLYSGNEISAPLREIYFGAIDQRYVKPTVAALKADLQSFAAGAPSNPPSVAAGGEQESNTANEDVLGRHYDLLKAYLMLAQADRVEPAFLSNQLQEYWKKSAPPEMELVSQKQLDFYARQAVYDYAPHYQADDKLVSEVQQKLLAYPAVNRFYKRVVTEINAKTRPVNLDSILQGRSGGVLNSTYTVPGSFTIDGYRNHMLEAFNSAADEISKDDWVMGSLASAQTENPDTNPPDITRLRSMYYKEYTDQWRRFLRGVSVQQFKTADDAVVALKAFSATDSPIERVLETVATNTNLSAKPESSGVWAWIKGVFSPKAKSEIGGATEVEGEFRPLFLFMSSADNKKDDSRMSVYRAQLGALLGSIDTAAPDQLAEIQKAVSSGKDEIGLQKTDQGIGRLLDDFKTAAGGDVAALLRQPLSALKRFFYGGGYEQIVKEWMEQIYPKAHALETGYPFVRGGQASVADLSAFLNPANGQMATFFKTRLANSFEGSPGSWKPKGSAPFSFSDDFVKYLNDTARLSAALFPNNGPQPAVSYQLEVQPEPNSIIKLTIDGTPLEVQGTSPATVKFTWPTEKGVSGAQIIVTSEGTELGPLPFNGEWGLFKMFDAGSPVKTDGGYKLSWNVGSATVHATLTPGSTANNPFDRQLFTNLHAPQKIEK